MSANACKRLVVTVVGLSLIGAGAVFAQARQGDRRPRKDRTANRGQPIGPQDAQGWYQRGKDLHGAGDNSHALEAYDKAFAIAGKSNNWLPLAATLASADILLHQLKYEEAMKTLNRYSVEDLRRIDAGWRVRMLRARGMVYVSQGKEPEAIAAFKEALVVEGAQ